MQVSSIRLLLALAAIHGFNVWNPDVTNAYLQSAAPHMREIYIKDPAPEFELSPDQCFKLLKPLYVLWNAANLWRETLDRHHSEDLDMRPLRSDLALHRLVKGEILHDLSGTYVEDMLRAGEQHVRNISTATSREFKMGESDCSPFTFTGFHIAHSDSDPTKLEMEQYNYIRKLLFLTDDSSFSHFASLRMNLMWLSHNRPDDMFEVWYLTQITPRRFGEERRDIIKRTIRTIQYVKDHLVSISFPKLDLATLRVIGYSDASYSSKHDLTSQLGYVSILPDGTGRCIPILFRSYKARFVVRSALSAEFIEFADIFDASFIFTLAEEPSSIHPKSPIPLKLYTDNKGLFEVIYKGNRTPEKRLMLDVFAAPGGFPKREISDIGFVRTAHNISDGLTRSMKQTALRNFLITGRHITKVEQLIVHSEDPIQVPKCNAANVHALIPRQGQKNDSQMMFVSTLLWLSRPG